MGGGFIYVAPMDYHQVCATKGELIPLTYREALSNAQAEPIPPQHGRPKRVGDDPSKWFVFFGWRYAHSSVGNPWCRRVHVTGCPYRQNGTGQNRRVVGDEEEEGEGQPTKEDQAYSSMPSWQKDIEQLRERDMIRVKWACTNWRLGRVLAIWPALYAMDVSVQIQYEGGFTTCEPLCLLEWVYARDIWDVLGECWLQPCQN